MASTDRASSGLYELPAAAGSSGNVVPRHMAAALFGAMLVCWIGTQYLAWRLGFQAALGEPLWSGSQWRLYSPFDGIGWYLRWARVVAAPVAHDFNLTAVAVGLGVAAVAVAATRRAHATLARLARGNENIHGSAHWATADEVKASGLMGSGSGVYVGAWKNPKTKKIHYLRHDGPEHIMAFAPTRSGKGVGLVLPTLLSWPHSALIYDIKGENWALTAGWRQQEAGNKVLKFEPTASDGSSVRFNPLDAIRLFTHKEVADAQNVMTMIVDPDGKGLEDHWQKTAQALLVGTVLHVLYAEDNKTLSGVVEMLTDPSRSMKDTLERMLNSDHDATGGERGWMGADGQPTMTHPVVAAVARDMMNKAEEEMSGVVSTAVSYLTLYRDPIVARNTSASEFKLQDLMNHDAPVSLYLVVPPSDKDRLRPLIRLVINQIVRSLTEKMEFKDGRSVAGYKHRLLLLLDEFPSLGKLDIFEESLAFIAGYGLKAYLIIQDISQLWTAYGKDESIFSNCHVRVAYAPNKVETAELLSKMAGTMTVVKEAKSYSGTRWAPKKNLSLSTQETQRPLLTPDEVMRLPAARKDARGNVREPGDMLIFIAGQTPIYGKQILYFLDPVFSARAKVPTPVASDRLREVAEVEASAREAPAVLES